MIIILYTLHGIIVTDYPHNSSFLLPFLSYICNRSGLATALNLLLKPVTPTPDLHYHSLENATYISLRVLTRGERTQMQACNEIILSLFKGFSILKMILKLVL